MTDRLKNVVKYGLSFALAVLLVIFAFRGIDWAAFWEGLVRTRWFWVLLFALASTAAIFFRTLRWNMLLHVFEPSMKNIDVWDALNVGNLVNVVLPGAGELLRCAYVGRAGGGFEKSFGTILMERVWDFAMVAVLLVLALSLNMGKFGAFFMESIWKPIAGRMDMSFGLVLGLLLVALCAACWAVWHFRERNALCGRLADAVKGLVQGFTGLASIEHKFTFVLCTVMVWAMYVLMGWFGIKAVPMLSDLGFVDAVFISAVGNIAAVIPVPGGIGAYHYLVALIVSSLYGQSWETGILYATLCHETRAVLVILLGVISYACLSLRRRKA